MGRDPNDVFTEVQVNGIRDEILSSRRSGADPPRWDDEEEGGGGRGGADGEGAAGAEEEFGPPVYAKVFNAFLLATSLGFVAYTLLNVDAGMTRGWTQQEIAVRLPMDAWSSYENSLAEKPVFTKTVINVVIYLLGDWLSQTVFRGRDVLDFDASRTLRNGFIGLCFGPVVHEYYEFSDHILPVDVGINRVYKIFMDQTLYLGVKCSVYLVAAQALAGVRPSLAWDNTRERMPDVMTTAWKFWPLVHCVTYTVIPAQHRVLWVNSVDLIWNAILATKASPEEEQEAETEAEPVGGGDAHGEAEGDGHGSGGGGSGHIVMRKDAPPHVKALEEDAKAIAETVLGKEEGKAMPVRRRRIIDEREESSVADESEWVVAMLYGGGASIPNRTPTTVTERGAARSLLSSTEPDLETYFMVHRVAVAEGGALHGIRNDTSTALRL